VVRAGPKGAACRHSCAQRTRMTDDKRAKDQSLKGQNSRREVWFTRAWPAASAKGGAQSFKPQDFQTQMIYKPKMHLRLRWPISLSIILTACLFMVSACAPSYSDSPVNQDIIISSIYWSDGDSGRINGSIKFRLNDIDAHSLEASGLSKICQDLNR